MMKTIVFVVGCIVGVHGAYARGYGNNKTTSYGGVAIGFNVVNQDQGILHVGDNNLPLDLTMKAGHISGGIFLGLSPTSFMNIEADFEGTELYNNINNDIQENSKLTQTIWGNNPIKTTIVTPLINVVLHTPTFHGFGAFAMGGVGASYIHTKITYHKITPYKKYTNTYSHFTRAYDIGTGIFYNIPNSSIGISLGFHYINLGNKFTKSNFTTNGTSKKELFLRWQYNI